MATDYILPKSKDLTATFGMLYGNNIDVAKADAKPLSENNVYGVFIDQEGAPVAATMCDAPFAAFSGSAMMMLPPGAAEESAETGELTQPMKENVHELINICSRLFMSDHTPHLKLGEMYLGESELPENVRSMIESAPDSAGFGVAFPRYGSGTISFVTT